MIALLVAAPRATRAQTQYRYWTNYCYTGAFQACASVQVGLFNYLDPQTQSTPLTAITIKIANLEGTLGNTPWGIVGFTLRGLQANGFPASSYFPAPTFEGSAQGVAVVTAPQPGYPSGPPGNFGAVWFWDPVPGMPGYSLLNRETQQGDGAYAIAGCDPVVNVNQPDGYLQTCGDGWIVYNFLHQGPMQVDQLQVSITSAPGPGYFSCTFDVDCIAVVPEPTTVLLLGSGLGLIGGFRLRRRRASRRRTNKRRKQAQLLSA